MPRIPRTPQTAAAARPQRWRAWRRPLGALILVAGCWHGLGELVRFVVLS